MSKRITDKELKQVISRSTKGWSMMDRTNPQKQIEWYSNTVAQIRYDARDPDLFREKYKYQLTKS
jgi:hypothetical protein